MSMETHCGCRPSRVRGFALIELLVVIAIVAILVALLLPAVQQVREAARKSQRQDHLHNLGVSAHNYESNYKRFPSSGESTLETGPAPFRRFFPISFFTAVLPFNEQENVYDGMNLSFHYSNAANVAAARSEIDVFLCPSSTQEAKDAPQFGVTDYMPIAYCDLDPTTGQRNASTATALNADRAGALGFCRPIAHCTDGTSNTIILIEDAMKPNIMAGRYDHSPTGPNWLRIGHSGIGLDTTMMFATANDPAGATGGNFSAPKRWTDPDNGNGWSGPPAGAPDQKLINNNTPKGGPAGCPWTLNKCGPNDEPFSGHAGGVQSAMGDGKVTFLSENTDRHVCRCLATPQDGEPVRVP
jgi:prepilin-type N-terminal cleavage/methylation domain-containing protein